MPKGRPGKTSTKYAAGARSAVDRGFPKDLVNILVDLVGVEEDEITMDATLMTDLGLDSLDVIEFTMALEQHYGIAIDDEVAEAFTTDSLSTVLQKVQQLGARLHLPHTNHE